MNCLLVEDDSLPTKHNVNDAKQDTNGPLILSFTDCEVGFEVLQIRPYDVFCFCPLTCSQIKLHLGFLHARCIHLLG